MTWFDEMDEQTQGQWRSRFEKGRLDLSASVEQALAEGAAQEVWEEEDGEEGEGLVVDEHAGEVRKGTTVIPPRLSLQTKPMYAVASHPAGVTSAGEAREPAQEKQHTGVFSRLAQRITMSLAAITLPFQAQVPVPEQPEQEIHVPMPGIFPASNLSMQTVTTVRIEHSETTTTIIEASPMQHSLPPAALSPLPTVPQLPQPDRMGGEGKPRPAGYPTKVHLEAAPKGISGHGTASANSKDAEVGYPPHDSTGPFPPRNTFSVPRSAPTLELPTVDAAVTREAAPSSPGGERGNDVLADMTTSGSLPSVRMPASGGGEGVSLSPSRAIFGTGSFEPGQGDVAVACPAIISTSVVWVMLASDPGPVVVQYVSLQVGSGFTVHLSAPTKVKTLFNYVVLRPQEKS